MNKKHLLYIFTLLLLIVSKVDCDYLNKESKKNTELTVDLNLHNGKILVLSDESIWEVSPTDISKSQLLVTNRPVVVERSDDKVYKYKIIDKSNGDFIFVKLLKSSS